MKKFTYIIIFVITLSLGSCSNLDKSPYEEISRNETFEKVIDAEYWTNGMYIRLRQTVYGAYVGINEVQADLLNMVSSRSYSDIHRWEPFTASDGNIRELWAENYRTIANINTALEGFPKIKPKDADEEELLKQYTGEMHLGRAFLYTRLATAFCKVYDANTASTDLGLPLEKVYDVKTKNQRASLQETYDFILSDITKAEDLLKNKTGAINADTFTIDAVKALKARVLMYMGKWEDAYKVAEDLISSNTYALATSSDELREIWHKDNAQESITQLYIATPNQLPSTNNIYFYIDSSKRYKSDYVPTKWTVDLFEDNDYRKSVYFEKVELFTAFNKPYSDIYIVHKYPINEALSTTGSDNYAHAPKVFRIPELYLIASESAFKNNDEGNARKYLNLLREARGLSSVTVTGDALFQEIKNERLRELAFEGFRLFDLKRWKEGVTRRVPQNTEFLEDTPKDQYYELNRSADDFKFVWPVPARDREHGNLQQNPGW
ncbi:RagB/SusD family nutrient uptake outer membrane protein [Capnocytophaga cynodegmi]|uniref:RagB/SusD family nutrient uptake outer membrane protein n=1 Tax=Capnocytophaga cynodegmi TaxID=28189 RepID=UPI003859889B